MPIQKIPLGAKRALRFPLFVRPTVHPSLACSTVIESSPAAKLFGSYVQPSSQTQKASSASGRQKACWEQVTPWQGSRQPTAGGLPMKEVRQEQVKLPGVLRQPALGPQMLGLSRHSLMSSHSVPADKFQVNNRLTAKSSKQ